MFVDEEIDAIELCEKLYLGAYDLDNDGLMEILIYSVWPGADGFDIYKIKDKEFKMIIGWNDEEDDWFYDEIGWKYFYKEGEFTYYREQDLDDGTDTKTSTETSTEEVAFETTGANDIHHD